MIFWLYNLYGRRKLDNIICIRKQSDKISDYINDELINENQKLKNRYLHPYIINYSVADAVKLFK